RVPRLAKSVARQSWFALTFAVQIKHDKRDAEQRLEDSLADVQEQRAVIQRMRALHARAHFLKEGLRILGLLKLVPIILNDWPFGDQPRPNRRQTDCNQ